MSPEIHEKAPWITKEGTSIFIPKSEPVLIPEYTEESPYSSFESLYEEGMLDQKPDPIHPDLPCSGCDAGKPHPALEVMAFDVGNIRDHQYTGTVSNHLYGLARDVLRWDYEEFEKAVALRGPQILWFMREQAQFFRESIHERINGWESGSRTVLLSHLESTRWTLVAHVMNYKVLDDGQVHRWIVSIPYNHESFRMRNGAWGDDAITIVLPLRPNTHT